MDYYNEWDPWAAEWIRNLMDAGQIPYGVVDTRSIEDVRPSDLKGFRHVHLFAGIGGWARAARLAGWPDTRPLWTASCPCQPFSQAGKGGGTEDERHLWPAAQWLITQCGPAEVAGEQVAGADGRTWLAFVQTDLERMGFTVGSADLCSASVGAPNIRQRLYWYGLANADDSRLEGRGGSTGGPHQRLVGPGGVADGLADADVLSHVGAGDGGKARGDEHPDSRLIGGMANADGGQRGGRSVVGGPVSHGQDAGRTQGLGGVAARGEAVGLEHTDGPGGGPGGVMGAIQGLPGDGEDERKPIAERGPLGSGGTRPADGFWRDADWLYCRDDAWRPVEPGLEPLVAGLPRGVGDVRAGVPRLDLVASLKRAKAYRRGSLQGYGNAINAELAAEFLRALK